MVSLQCVLLGGMLDRHLLKYIFHNDYIHMVSRLCVLKCSLRCLFCGYDLPHWYVFLPLCVCLCAIRLWFNEKPCHNNHIGIDFLLYAFPSDFWGHYHLSFFSVCNHMWLINSLSEKTLSHWMHEYDFSFMFIVMWLVSSLLCEKKYDHTDYTDKV